VRAVRPPRGSRARQDRRVDDDPARRKKAVLDGHRVPQVVTFHGLALNVTTDLAYFGRINPCGFESAVMTSMAAQLGAIDIAEVKRVLAEELGRVLDRSAG